MDGTEQVEVEQSQDRTADFECPSSPRPAIKHIDVPSERIQPSPSAKNIGVIFDQHLSFDQHVTSIFKSSFFPFAQYNKDKGQLINNRH